MREWIIIRKGGIEIPVHRTHLIPGRPGRMDKYKPFFFTGTLKKNFKEIAIGYCEFDGEDIPENSVRFVGVKDLSTIQKIKIAIIHMERRMQTRWENVKLRVY